MSVRGSTSVRGSQTIAESLRVLGVRHVFGLVGIPVIEVAEACIAAGIQFVAFRNEQSAVYAASIYGFLTGRPGVCLVVGGPGLVHALAGVENANANRFPMLLLAGSAETSMRGLGAFQQLDQISLVKAAGAKFAEQPPDIASVARLVRQAYLQAYFGKPGTTYIDLPADLIQGTAFIGPGMASLGAPAVETPEAPRSGGDPQRIAAAALALKEARFPLLIIGKGCAYSRAEHAVRRLQAATDLAFVPTPMGKGVVSDAHHGNLSAARSGALKTADVVLVLGARLNWILHFGATPRFKAGRRVIQVDSVAEELHAAQIPVLGDVGLVADQLLAELRGWRAPPIPAELRAKRRANENKTRVLETPPKSARHFVASPSELPPSETLPSSGSKSGSSAEDTVVPGSGTTPENSTVETDATSTSALKPLEIALHTLPPLMTYHTAYKVIRDVLESEVRGPLIYVNEGANTMDIGRSSFPLVEPRCRLDAGTNATMGVGMGYAICAKVARPEATVVALEGDSAFGFSAAEIETAVRADLPMVVFVMNNSGVYHGSDPALYGVGRQLPPTALSLQTRYDVMAHGLGAVGYEARSLDDLENATVAALRSKKVAVINVIIDPAVDKKLEFGWMAKKPKL